jgi:protocatechuate 3,4-dioxygenase beta subunit
LVEIWQANSTGRYPHPTDQHKRTARSEFLRRPAAPSPDADGRYRFITIRPGEYPWRYHYKRLAARPISISRCSGAPF